MIELTLPKADPVVDPVPDTHIVINEPLPTWESRPQWDLFSSEKGKALEEALVNALPGSIYDQLFVCMCVRKASHYRITVPVANPAAGYPAN